MLESYGRCPACRTVVFCWVMQAPDIVQQVLRTLPAGLFAPKLVTLTASREALAARVEKDIGAGLRGADAVARALRQAVESDPRVKGIPSTKGAL